MKRAALSLLIGSVAGFAACESPRAAGHAPKPESTTQPGEAIVRGVVDVPRRIIGAVTDPTGARALSAKLEKETDVEAFNQAVREIRDSAALLKERIAAVPPDIGQTVAAGVRGAQLEALSDRLAALADAARQRVDGLDTAALNDAVAEVRGAIAATREKITALDGAAFNEAIREIRFQVSRLDVEAVNAAIREIRGKVAELDVSITNTAVADANDTLTRARLPLHLCLWLGAVLLTLLILCAAVRLFRPTRGFGSRQSLP